MVETGPFRTDDQRRGSAIADLPGAARELKDDPKPSYALAFCIG